jgi:hypothetical protein
VGLQHYKIKYLKNVGTVEAASCLMRVNAEIKVGDHAGHILAVQVVVGHVDIPHTPSNKHTGSEQNSGKIAYP